MTLLTAMLASVSGAAPWKCAGYSIAPTPMIVPCPSIRRGMECSVPIVPGLVSVIVVPAKSSTVSLLLRARRTMSSYADQNAAKSLVSAALMDGTRSWRVPSGLVDVDGEAEIHVRRVDDDGLAVDLGEVRVHRGTPTSAPAPSRSR